MASIYASYPLMGGGGGGVPTYANLAAFPSAITSGNGALAIALDTNILYESNGTSWLEIASPTTVTTVGTIDSEATPSANGATISSNSLIMQSASATVPGLVNNTTQIFTGTKQFNGLMASNGGFVSLPMGTANSGANFSSNAFNLDGSYWTGSAAAFDTWTAQIVLGGGANPFSILNFAHAGTSGAVTTNFPAIDNTPIGPFTPSSAAFTTLSASSTTTLSSLTASLPLQLNSSKQVISAAIDLSGSQATGVLAAARFPAQTGDVTTVAGALATTLATVNSNVGSFGSSTSIPSFTVNGKGLITAAGGNAVIAPAGTLSGTTLNSTVVTSSLTSLGVQAQALNMGTQQITNVVDPTTAQMAATKNYVDTVASGLNPIQAVTVATVGSNIPGTYVQVGGGIGDTFTVTATTTFTLDGITPSVGQRVLFKDQTSGQQNGVYTLTTLANVGVLGAIFTRALDYDTVADVNAGDIIPVISGTVNASTSWLQTATVTSVGSSGTPMVFAQWTANPANYLLKANNLSDVTTKATAFNNISPMTTGGDIIYGGASGVGTRLANGSAGQVLTSAGTTAAPTWATPTTGTVTAVSVASANGFAGTSSGGATPALTLTTSATGFLTGNGTAISGTAAATVGNEILDTGSSWISSAAPMKIQNVGLKCSVASSALTIALTQSDGSTNASSTAPAMVSFRSSTATTGGYSTVAVTGALSIVVPSSATLGQVSAVNQYVWVYALNNAGTIELAVSGVNVFPDNSIQTTTTIGAGSTSGTVLYSATGRSSVAIRLIGRLLVNESTAGTWASAPTDVITDPNPIPTITELVSITPTFVACGTVTSPVCFTRRVGGVLEGYYNWTNGTTTASTFSMTFGSGLTVLSTLPAVISMVGNGITSGTGSTQCLWVYATASGTTLNMGFKDGSDPGLTADTGSGMFPNSSAVSVAFRLPINGWSTYGP